MLRQWYSQRFSQLIRPMTLRHHLVTMTNGKPLAKTNQRIIHSLIVFLVWIVFFHSTSCSAFVFGVQASQRSPKTPDNSISKQRPCNCNFKFLAASTWWPCAFQADICPNNYSICWNSGRQQSPLQFECHHKLSSLICYYRNNDSNNDSSPHNSDNDSSPRNSNCNYKSKTTQAWWMLFASHQNRCQQCNDKKWKSFMPKLAQQLQQHSMHKISCSFPSKMTQQLWWQHTLFTHFSWLLSPFLQEPSKLLQPPFATTCYKMLSPYLQRDVLSSFGQWAFATAAHFDSLPLRYLSGQNQEAVQGGEQYV